ncbi:MAG: hypothetical protein IPP07_31880 [Holophagales bacterium]|jgi:hypothetical protein|nr:hypothetical protein [Holophagales bacterium]
MRQFAALALAFSLIAAPAALAATETKAGTETKVAAEKKCDPATCKDKSKCAPATCKGQQDHKSCTPEMKAKCGADKAAPAAPKS